MSTQQPTEPTTRATSSSGPVPGGPDAALADLTVALLRLVARGAISEDQRAAILAEVMLVGAGRVGSEQVAAGPGAPFAIPPTGGPGVTPLTRRHRTLSEVLIEVGLYVGSALVVAAMVVLAAQNWEGMSRGAQIAYLGGAAVVTAAIGLLVARGATLGSARRRVAGVLLVATAATSAGTVALALEGFRLIGTAAMATALIVMVGANFVAASAITEVGMFAAGFAVTQIAIEDLHPARELVTDQWGMEYYASTAYDRLAPLVGVAFGLLWALVVARRMMHREVAVFLGMAVAVVSALPVVAAQETRAIGLATMALLAAVGFWRFMIESHWPWLAASIAALTAFVFWAVGGSHRPALAILVAGLVMLGSSAVGMQVARRRGRVSSHPPAGTSSGGTG
ncbi:MAG: hypothetical protein WCF04_11190 [Candidatus Nanopelagicales bacterium]